MLIYGLPLRPQCAVGSDASRIADFILLSEQGRIRWCRELAAIGHGRYVMSCRQFIAIAVIAASSWLASAGVMIRDAMGGDGFFTEDTQSVAEFQIDFLGPRDVEVGAFDFEFEIIDEQFQSFYTYCAEPGQLVGFDEFSLDPVGLDYELQPLSAIDGLSGGELEFIEILWFHAFADSLTSSIKAAAFQSVIWELTLDDVMELDAGEFQIGDDSPEVNIQAQVYIDLIHDGIWSQRQSLVAMTHPNSQDFLIPTALAPEPSALAMIFVIGSLAIRRR